MGECILAILPFAFLFSVIGMILLFLLILVKIIKERHIKDVSQFMLKNMAFFFIPVVVSIIDNITYLQGHIMVFLLICIVATLLTFIATLYAVIGVMKLQEKITAKRGQKHHE
ncbi:MAG: CidA/LrgA family protein [Acutalibacteraceae bacterium]|nr:CidA/LrgA family protein [Acutalibacteraceae bacterium]